MYAQIRKYHSMRGGQTVEQVCREIERTGLPQLENIPGFVDYYAMELEDGGLLTVSVYEDRAGVEAGKKASMEWNTKQSGGALPERPDESFEGQVRIQSVQRKKPAAV